MVEALFPDAAANTARAGSGHKFILHRPRTDWDRKLPGAGGKRKTCDMCCDTREIADDLQTTLEQITAIADKLKG